MVSKADVERWERLTPKQQDWYSILAHVLPADFDIAVKVHRERFPDDRETAK